MIKIKNIEVKDGRISIVLETKLSFDMSDLPETVQAVVNSLAGYLPDIVREVANTTSTSSNTDANNTSDKPTEKQISYAKRLGIPNSIIEKASKSELSVLIDEFKQKKGGK